jgi:hypothetical protein
MRSVDNIQKNLLALLIGFLTATTLGGRALEGNCSFAR